MQSQTSNNILVRLFMESLDESIQYDLSWDALMPVIQKIRLIETTARKDQDLKAALLHYQRNEKTIFDLSILETLEFTYTKVIAFILWYFNYVSTKTVQKIIDATNDKHCCDGLSHQEITDLYNDLYKNNG